MAPAPLADALVQRLAGDARTLIERRRHALQAQFGWTHLRATVHVKPAERHLVVHGEVLVPRVTTHLESDLRSLLPDEWSLTVNLRPLAAGRWRTLPPGITPLDRVLRHAAEEAPALATELLPADGPVQCLAHVHRARLVRAVDGTIGWTRSPLGPAVPAPVLPLPRLDIAALERILRSYLGVPYLLGGTTRRGIDCSGLVQRGVRHALRHVVPRHTLDQLRAAGAPGRSLGEPGDLVYTWAPHQDACHVGIVLRGSRPRLRTVVHASTTRRRVIEEPLDRFVARAAHVCHVEPAQLLDRRSCPPAA